MITILVEISKYVLLFFMMMFTWGVYRALGAKDKETRSKRLRGQLVWMILFNFVAYLVLYIQTWDITMIVMYGAIALYIILTQILYHVLYSRASFILLNVMSMLLSIGLVIQTRLGVTTAMRQLMIASAATVISLFIPVFIRKVKGLQNIGMFFAILGILLIGAVFAFAKVYGGGKLSVEIGGITFQFSEFVKITFVFFIAGMLREVTDFRQVLKVTVLAGIHVVILVISTDLGAALIYFVAYMVMVCVATHKLRYAFLGLGGMAAASYVAYKLFYHVQVRVQVWMDPFADYQGTGYQIVQALFAVVAGGWFGTGLMQGSPASIPLVKEDFTFAAICEEMGILFAICLILLCMGLYLVIINIAMKLNNQFYKLIAIGLGTEYAFQVFLTIGGTTKFIPMTGITLPLISYGGSSVMCTIFMLAIVQGLYVLRKDEGVEDEERQKAAAGRQQQAVNRTEQVQRPVDGSTKRIQQPTDYRTKRIQQPLQNSKPGVQDNKSGAKSDPDDLEEKIRKATEESLYW